MTKVGFYFDQTRCAGCKTCQVTCKDQNNLGVGVILREVRSYTIGMYPDVKMYHYSATCNHCDTPACMTVCPVGAMKKADDGTVYVDKTLCIGCGSCTLRCPYGVPKLDLETGYAQKCDGCMDLRAKGETPACVAACPFRALDFGDVDELKAKYGSDLVTSLPAQGEGKTNPNTLIKARSYAAKELGTQITL